MDLVGPNPPAAPDDAELVRRASTGERAAQAEIVNRHYARILRYLCGQTSNRQDAENVAQETFVAAFRELGRVQLRVPLIAFLTGIAYRRSARLHRDNARHCLTPVPDHPGVEQPSAELSPAEALEESDARERLDAAARGQLNPHQYAVFRLRFFEGLSPSELAPVIGGSARAARLTLLRVRAWLSRRLKDYL